MSAQLKLVSTQAPWIFESLGTQDNSGNFIESDLFPLGQVVELTEGHFPMYDFHDMIDGATHTIGGKVLSVYRFDVALEPMLPLEIPTNPTDEIVIPQKVYKSCVLYVKLAN